LDDILNLVFGIFDIDDFDGDGLSCPTVDTGATLASELEKERWLSCPLYTFPKLPPPYGPSVSFKELGCDIVLTNAVLFGIYGLGINRSPRAVRHGSFGTQSERLALNNRR
jgi:hypothetical protein